MATSTVRTVEPGITIITLSGRLNVGRNLSAVQTQIQEFIQFGARKIILDFSGVEYIDSASLGMLTGCHTEMQDAGGQIRIAGAQGPVDRTLHVIHMEKIMPVDASVDIALKALS
jgi:anti-sigma B factor antagonist